MNLQAYWSKTSKWYSITREKEGGGKGRGRIEDGRKWREKIDAGVTLHDQKGGASFFSVYAS